MDIERLQRKRQLNVQEQNALTEYRIFSEASYWRKNGLPKALIKVFEDKGIIDEKYIIVKYEQNFPGVQQMKALLLLRLKGLSNLKWICQRIGIS